MIEAIPSEVTLPASSVMTGDFRRVLPYLPEGCVDLTITSPDSDGMLEYAVMEGCWRWVFPIKDLVRELLRVTAPGGVVVVSAENRHRNYEVVPVAAMLALTFTQVRRQAGEFRQERFHQVDEMIRIRKAREGAWNRTHFRRDHEHLLVFAKGKQPRTFHKDVVAEPSKHAGKTYKLTRISDSGRIIRQEATVKETKCRGTVWSVDSANREHNSLKSQHPDTMPDVLARELVRVYSNPHELVLDPLAGSGTTCVVARQEGRMSLGCDKNPAWVALAEQRLAQEAPPGDDCPVARWDIFQAGK